MDLLVVIGDEARLNFMWLPGWVAFNTSLQQQILDKVSEDFNSKYKRDATTSDEDMEVLNRLIIKHMSNLVPAKGISKMLRAITEVTLSPTKGNVDKFLQERFNTDSQEQSSDNEGDVL